MPATIIDIDPMGRLMIDLRPGVWLSLEVQASKIRHREQGSSDESSSQEGWRLENDLSRALWSCGASRTQVKRMKKVEKIDLLSPCKAKSLRGGSLQGAGGAARPFS